MIDEIRKEGREAAAYDLSRAMQEAQDVIDFARGTKNTMAYFKAVQHRAALAGLLVEQLHVKTEVVDLAGALKEAMHRVIDITPSTCLPMPKPDEEHSLSASVPDVFGD